MSVDFMRQLFDWLCHEDRWLWDEGIAPLDERLFRLDTGYSLGSLRATTTHVVDVMAQNLRRLQSDEPTPPTFDNETPCRDEIRQAWDGAEAGWRAYIEALDAAEFQRGNQIVYRQTAMTVPNWQIMFHVINHNTLHRAEMLDMISRLGAPLDLDISLARYCML